MATEVGRQPWIVYGVMRVEDAVTTAPGMRMGLYALVVVYALLTWGTVFVLRRLAAVVWRRRFVPARLAAGAAVAAVLWGWAAGQYPFLLARDLTIEAAAADPVTLRATLISLGAGSVLVVPSLAILLVTAQRARQPSGSK